MRMRNNLQINITLPPEVKAAADRYTVANYVKFSQLVRDMLTEKLKKEGYLPTPTAGITTEEVPA